MSEPHATYNISPLISHARAPLFIASIAAIGRAIQTHNGGYDPVAIPWLAIGFVLALIACFARLDELVALRSLRLCLFGVGIFSAVWILQQLWFDSPLGDEGVPPSYYVAGPAILTIAAIPALMVGRCARPIAFAILLSAHFFVGVWLLNHSRTPYIDVYVVGQEACKAFSQGHNPYSINIPDIYTAHPDWQKNFYPPDYLAHGPVKLSYSYMPLSFIVAWTGYLVSGDTRIGNLMAICAAAGLLGWAGRGRLAILAACLLLLSPRLFYLIYNGWTEPVILLCLALTIVAACRNWTSLPWIFGLLLASKQYMLLCAPLAILLSPRLCDIKPILSFYLKAAVAATAVTLPLALWDIHAFWHTVVALPIASPFRFDSLSFSAAWEHSGHLVLPGWVGFAAALLAMLVALLRLPRTPAAFAAAVAVVYFCFFAFAKQAFGNYYFLPIGAMCCSIMASGFETNAKALNE